MRVIGQSPLRERVKSRLPQSKGRPMLDFAVSTRAAKQPELFDWQRPTQYDDCQKAAFHRAAINRLKLLATQLDWPKADFDLRSNKAGIAVSGEIALHHERVYISVSQSCMGCQSGILIRTCKGRRDYTGGRNHMTDEEGKALSVLIRMQEPGEVSSQQAFDRASKDELDELRDRHIVKICHRGTAIQHGKDPGFRRAHKDELKVRKVLKICRKTAEEVQVGTPHVANVLAHAHREASRGPEGWATGLQRKEKAIQKRRLRKLSRIKRAGKYWEKRSPTQETSGASNNKERHNKQIRISARVIRTSDPKLRIKIIFSGHRLDNRGVMSLKIYSTRREKMKLSTLVTKRANKKGQYIRSNTRRTKDNNEQKDWWKTLSNSNRNWKRKSLNGSTDLYLLKRTIELEIDYEVA